MAEMDIENDNDILRKLIDKLHDEAIDVELPQIAVMGDTSSGKSSLLSSLSGIQFPSNDELTTRCPARLHMSRSRDTSSKEFFASVHIKWHEDSKYEEPFAKLEFRGENDVKQNLPSGIAAAQKFIVEKSKREVCFDVVEIEYTSSSSLDLTVIDLPGYVRSVGKGESSNIVSQINELNKIYLINTRCIILAVLPANVDFHNSQILADAREVDPSTERIIPVITKPDLVDSGAEKGVLQLLRGEKTDEYRLGFHIVKSRGQQALNDGKSIDVGLREEEEFFNTQGPWKDFKDKEKMGTANLRRYLAKLQVDMMKREVPNIVREVEKNLTIYEEELKYLGQDLSSDTERRCTFEEAKRNLNMLLYNNICGNSKAEWKSSEAELLGYQFRALVQRKMALFAENVRQSRLACTDKIDVGSSIQAMIDNLNYGGKVLKIDGKEVIIHIDTPPIDFVIGEIVTVKDNGNEYRLRKLASGPNNYLEGILKSSGVLHSLEKKQISHKVPRDFGLSLDDISIDNSMWLLELVRKNRGRDLPLFTSADLFNKLVRDIINESIAPLVLGLLNDVQSVLVELIRWVVEDSIPDRLSSFRFWVATELETIVLADMEQLRKRVSEKLEEECHPYTNSPDLFEALKKLRLKGMTEKMSSSAFQVNNVAVVSVDTANRIINTLFNEMTCEEHMAQEIDFGLRAYGKQAAKRIFDDIPMIIDTHLLMAIPVKILSWQLSDLELSEILSERSSNKTRRDALKEKLKKTKRAKEAISSILKL